MSTQRNFITKVRNDIESLKSNQSSNIKDVGRLLADNFIKVRLQNSQHLESTKSRAVELLTSQLDDSCSVDQLSKIISLLNSISGSDIEKVINLLPYLDNSQSKEVKLVSNLLSIVKNVS